MRLLARLDGLAYVAHENKVWLLPTAAGIPGNVVSYPQIEANGLRRHSDFLRRHDRVQEADEYETAACAIERYIGRPSAVAVKEAA